MPSVGAEALVDADVGLVAEDQRRDHRHRRFVRAMTDLAADLQRPAGIDILLSGLGRLVGPDVAGGFALLDRFLLALGVALLGRRNQRGVDDLAGHRHVALLVELPVERLPAIEETIGVNLDKAVADAGYRGHNAPKDKMFKVHVAGYKRGLTKAVKRALRRRAAIEPVIGHLKNDHRMGRNFLAFAEGDANNAVLAAVGYNFNLLLNWTPLFTPGIRGDR